MKTIEHKDREEDPYSPGSPPIRLAAENRRAGPGVPRLLDGTAIAAQDETHDNIFHWMKNFLKNRGDADPVEGDTSAPGEMMSADHEEDINEKSLIGNIVALRDATVVDVMIPRADISAIDINITQKDLFALLSEKQFSRFPVYRETLDDVIGTIHIKDIMASMARGGAVPIARLVRDVPIVSPSLPVLDLILLMRSKRKHMALVIDEFGGIDGLVTIGDVVEAIIGQIDDEYDQAEDPKLISMPDGTILADGRYPIEQFEEQYGEVLTEDERAEIDTLGGLIFAAAGRVPARGQIVSHSSGIIFEIVDADARRVNRVRIKNAPLQKSTD